MKKLLLILSLLLCVLGRVDGQEAEKAKVDSLRREATKLPHGIKRLEKLSELVTVSQLMPDGVNDAYLLLEEAERLNIDTTQANALTFIVNHHYMYDESLDSVEYWARRGMKVARKAKSWRMYFEMQYTMINSLVFSRRYEYALDQADMMLAEAEKLKDYSGITKAYVIMAQIYIGTYRWHEADDVLKKAMKTMYKNDDLQMQFTVLMHSLDYNIFVQRFDRMGQTLKEIDIVMDKMLLLAPGMDITLNDHRLFVEYCHILYWSYMGDFDKAAKHEAKGKVFYDRLTYPPYKPLYLYALCYNRTCRGMLDEAILLNDKAMKLGEKINVRMSNLLTCLIMRADIFYRQKKYGQALEIYRQIRHANDSISKLISNEQTEELQNMGKVNSLKAEEELLRGRMGFVGMVIVLLVVAILIVIMQRLMATYVRLKKTERKTADALAEAEEHNRQKENFFNTMSLAIRNPLKEVVTMTKSLVDDDNLTVEQRSQTAEAINHHTERLMFLVTGVLDLSRLESGMTKWQISNHDFVALCSDSVAKARLRWPEAQYSYSMEVSSFCFDFDGPRLEKVIDSMLTGTIDLPYFNGNVSMKVFQEGKRLKVEIKGSPLLLQRQDESTLMRHDINRLTLETVKDLLIVVVE